MENRVRGNQPGKVDGIAGGRFGDRGLLGLPLVRGDDRSATAPSAKYDLCITAVLAKVANPFAEVNEDVFHDERGVVVRIACARAEDMHTAACQFLRQGE